MRKTRYSTTWNIPLSITFSLLHFMLYRGKSITFVTVCQEWRFRKVVITQRKLYQNRKYFILWRKGLARGLKKQRWKILCTVSVRDIIKLSQRHLVDCLQALLIWPFIPNLTEIFDRSVLKLTYPLKVKFWPARALSRTAKFSPLLIHFKRESHMILTPFSMSQNRPGPLIHTVFAQF